MMEPSTFDAFRASYKHFKLDDRILLSAHSHQAWPDVARQAQTEVFDASAQYVDDKWDRVVMPLMDEVGRRILPRMGFDQGDAIAFAESTHQLVYRLLSALDLKTNPRVVTSTSEFHSLHRQLARLAEDGLDVVWVDAAERATIAERMVEAITPETQMVAISQVLFEDAYIVDKLDAIIERGQEVGAIVLIDAYHSFNVVPMHFAADRRHLFVTTGGYKYAQFGEGLCFLRIPADCKLRPAYTGWFADFASLAKPRSVEGAVGYADGGARFAGATFETSALFRAKAVLDHWDRFELGVEQLRAISVRQTSRLIDGIDEAGFGQMLVSERAAERRGGFVTLRVPQAQKAVSELRKKNVFVDARGELLRLGPAPYLTDDQLDTGVGELASVLRGMS